MSLLLRVMNAPLTVAPPQAKSNVLMRLSLYCVVKYEIHLAPRKSFEGSRDGFPKGLPGEGCVPFILNPELVYESPLPKISLASLQRLSSDAQ